MRKAIEQAHIVLPNKREKSSQKKQAEPPQQNENLTIFPQLVALSKLQPVIHQ